MAGFGALALQENFAAELAEEDIGAVGGDKSEADDAFVKLAENAAGNVGGAKRDLRDRDKCVDANGGRRFGVHGFEGLFMLKRHARIIAIAGPGKM